MFTRLCGHAPLRAACPTQVQQLPRVVYETQTFMLSLMHYDSLL